MGDTDEARQLADDDKQWHGMQAYHDGTEPGYESYIAERDFTKHRQVIREQADEIDRLRAEVELLNGTDGLGYQ